MCMHTDRTLSSRKRLIDSNDSDVLSVQPGTTQHSLADPSYALVHRV